MKRKRRRETAYDKVLDTFSEPVKDNETDEEKIYRLLWEIAEQGAPMEELDSLETTLRRDPETLKTTYHILRKSSSCDPANLVDLGAIIELNVKQAKRLEEGCCPVHGMGMGQITGYWVGDDGREVCYAACGRKDCEIAAKFFEPYGPGFDPVRSKTIIKTAVNRYERKDKKRKVKRPRRPPKLNSTLSIM